MELTVMPGGLEAKEARLASCKELQLNACVRTIAREADSGDNLPVDDARMKAIYPMVKFLTLCEDPECREAYPIILNFYYTVEDALVGMPVEAFMRWFPIEKKYDGRRWGSKDYYSTMAYLDSQGYLSDGAVIDEVDKVSELLMEYHNPLIFDFVIKAMLAISASCQARGEETPMEHFCKENGITTYTMNELPNGKTLLSGNDGSQKVVSKSKPRAKHLQIMKGGKGYEQS